jgi:hypothetical protein
MSQKSLLFSWTNPTQRTDESELTPDEINGLSYRLYEDGELIVDDIGEINFDLLLSGDESGVRSYTVTAVLGIEKLESPHSVPVAVNFTPAKAPTNLQVQWSADEASVGGSVG